MARITVEDCLDHVENRFELVILASKRARALATSNAQAKVPEENDKPTVIALREIGIGAITNAILAQEAEQAAVDSMVEELQETDSGV